MDKRERREKRGREAQSFPLPKRAVVVRFSEKNDDRERSVSSSQAHF
jgi:hypothetical protein